MQNKSQEVSTTEVFDRLNGFHQSCKIKFILIHSREVSYGYSMAHGSNNSIRSEGIQVEQCLAYASEQVEKMYGGIYGAVSLAKKSASIFSRKYNIHQTEYLSAI